MHHSSFNKTCSLDFPVGFAPTGSGKSPKGLNGSGKSPKGLNGFFCSIGPGGEHYPQEGPLPFLCPE